MTKGKLYIIPNYLGENSLFDFDNGTKSKINEINHFIFENEKNGRAFINRINPKKDQSVLNIKLLNKFTEFQLIYEMVKPCLEGNDVALISDAGCACVADPGKDLVMVCHNNKIKVKPLVGPSSILLALMASGLDGQNFEFIGYLPIKTPQKKRFIKDIEIKSRKTTQIFIETPYRNNKLINNLSSYLKPSTVLCVASELSLKNESVVTDTIENWKKKKIDLNKKPSIFLIQSK